jgi:DNA-directed RNA polymerase subunit beta
MTIKSDDVVGKRAAYSAIINHREIPQPNIPDAFKLLTKILQGLCLKITVETDKGNHADFDEFARTIEETMQIFSGATETKVAEIESSKYNESEALNSTVSKTEGSKGE